MSIYNNVVFNFGQANKEVHYIPVYNIPNHLFRWVHRVDENGNSIAYQELLLDKIMETWRELGCPDKLDFAQNPEKSNKNIKEITERQQFSFEGLPCPTFLHRTKDWIKELLGEEVKYVRLELVGAIAVQGIQTGRMFLIYTDNTTLYIDPTYEKDEVTFEYGSEKWFNYQLTYWYNAAVNNH